MPIKVICEKRHHLGESDIFYPAVFCDACGKRITDGDMANYCYTPNYDCTNEEFYNQQFDIYYIHVECCAKLHALSTQRKEPVRINTANGTISSEVFARCWGRLTDFSMWLGRNLGIALTKVEESVELKLLLSGMQRSLNWKESDVWEGTADELALMVFEGTYGNLDLSDKELVKLLRSSKRSLDLRGYAVAISGKPNNYLLEVSRLAS